MLYWRDHRLHGLDQSLGVPAGRVFKRSSHAASCQRQTEVSNQLWLVFKLECHQGTVLHK